MPIYEYKCNSCLSVIEHFQVKADGGPKKIPCPVCKDKDADKIISPGIFRFDKIFTAGGPTHQDKDGGLGHLDGDHQEESEKQQRDYAQAKAKGKGNDYIFGQE